MLSLLFLGTVFCQDHSKTATCHFNKAEGSFFIVEEIDKTGIAWAYWNNTINQTGWYQLHIIGNEGYTNSTEIMYCAGMLEGYIAQEGIWNHFNLIRDIKNGDETENPAYPRKREGEFVYPYDVFNYMDQNKRYTRQSIESYPDVKYWQEVGLVISQFDGLLAGYNFRLQKEKKDEDQHLNEFDMWFFQSAGDMFDIAAMFPEKQKLAMEFREHCSGMVKITDDYKDVFFSHDAWSDYRELHGELKEYNLPIKEFNAKRMIMSTRVGKIASYDDFYLMDSGLFVIETTLNNYNDDLYKVCTPKSLFTWVRAYRASWVATNGSDWASTFILHNSGTYNNQYVIVDSNKLERGKKPEKDLLWIIEQFPGTYRMTDVTYQLVEDTYFPSVNSPWHEDLYNLAGYPALVESLGIYGAYRSNKNSPRFQIMMREAKRIKTFEDFKAFMRYNNWQHDPFAQGDSAQQIASRYDLRPAEGTPYGARNNFGDLDSKCLRLTEAITRMKMHGFASPPYEHNPVWDFDAEPWKSKIHHDGLPAVWNFTWTPFQSMDYDICAPANGKSKEDCFKISKLCGWCQSSRKCLPGEKEAPWFDEQCEAGWVIENKIQSWALAVIIPVTVISCLFVIFVVAMHYITLKKQQTLTPQ